MGVDKIKETLEKKNHGPAVNITGPEVLIQLEKCTIRLSLIVSDRVILLFF